MRILSFTKMWDKLERSVFTTFRFKRKDRDWQIGEVVRVVYKQRSPERRELGIAEIIDKEPKRIPEDVTDIEAKEDGFQSINDMAIWMRKRYGSRIEKEQMNRLTLKWVAFIKTEDLACTTTISNIKWKGR